MCSLRLRARLDVGPDALRSPHATTSELAAQRVVARERAVEIPVRKLDGARKAKGVERCLGHAHPYMWTRHERRIPEQDHAPLSHARALKIEDRLEKRLRELDDSRHLRCKGRRGDILELARELGPDQRRGNRGAVMVPGGIRAKVAQLNFYCGRPVPDVVPI